MRPMPLALILALTFLATTSNAAVLTMTFEDGELIRNRFNVPIGFTRSENGVTATVYNYGLILDVNPPPPGRSILGSGRDLIITASGPFAIKTAALQGGTHIMGWADKPFFSDMVVQGRVVDSAVPAAIAGFDQPLGSVSVFDFDGRLDDLTLYISEVPIPGAAVLMVGPVLGLVALAKRKHRQTRL